MVMLQDKTKPFIFKHPSLILEVGDAGFVSDDTTVADCRLIEVVSVKQRTAG